MDDLIFRWATLIWTVREGVDRRIRVGHTLMQKLMYLLQAAAGVNIGYRFRLYYYGPYSEEVWNEIRMLADMDVLKVTDDPDGYGYWISLGAKGKYEIFLEAQGQLPKIQIKELIEELGSLDSRKLELIATTHFVCSDLVSRNGKAVDETVKASVTNLKPHFSALQVQSALEFLTQRGWSQ